MKIVSEIKQLNVSPRKVRIVADEIRELPISEALVLLTFTRKRAARPLRKGIESAIANATNNANLSRDSLAFAAIEVNEGSSFKRFRPSTRGRVHPYKRRTSHVRIILEDSVKEVKVEKTEVKEEPKKA